MIITRGTNALFAAAFGVNPEGVLICLADRVDSTRLDDLAVAVSDRPDLTTGIGMPETVLWDAGPPGIATPQYCLLITTYRGTSALALETHADEVDQRCVISRG